MVLPRSCVSSAARDSRHALAPGPPAISCHAPESFPLAPRMRDGLMGCMHFFVFAGWRHRWRGRARQGLRRLPAVQLSGFCNRRCADRRWQHFHWQQGHEGRRRRVPRCGCNIDIILSTGQRTSTPGAATNCCPLNELWVAAAARAASCLPHPARRVDDTLVASRRGSFFHAYLPTCVVAPPQHLALVWAAPSRSAPPPSRAALRQTAALWPSRRARR